MADGSPLISFFYFFLAWHSLFPPHWKVLIPPQCDPKLLSAFFSVWDGTCRCPCRCWAGWKGTVAVGHQCHTFLCGSMLLRSLIAHPQMPEFYPKPVLNIPVQCLWNLGPEKEHLVEGTWGAWAPWSCALICGEVKMRNFCFKCHFFGLCLIAPWVFLVPFPKGGSWMQSLVPLLGSSPPLGLIAIPAGLPLLPVLLTIYRNEKQRGSWRRKPLISWQFSPRKHTKEKPILLFSWGFVVYLEMVQAFLKTSFSRLFSSIYPASNELVCLVWIQSVPSFLGYWWGFFCFLGFFSFSLPVCLNRFQLSQVSLQAIVWS